MVEIWELVNEQKQKTGILHERAYSELIPKGLYHIVVEIWTKTKDGEILLTQRHPSKPMGLLWECTMGFVVVGEESEEGAARELAEETGICVRKEDLIYLGEIPSIPIGSWILIFIFPTRSRISVYRRRKLWMPAL